jgi:hypothetical protein
VAGTSRVAPSSPRCPPRSRRQGSLMAARLDRKGHGGYRPALRRLRFLARSANGMRLAVDSRASTTGLWANQGGRRPSLVGCPACGFLTGNRPTCIELAACLQRAALFPSTSSQPCPSIPAAAQPAIVFLAACRCPWGPACLSLALAEWHAAFTRRHCYNCRARGRKGRYGCCWCHGRRCWCWKGAMAASAPLYITY